MQSPRPTEHRAHLIHGLRCLEKRSSIQRVILVKYSDAKPQNTPRTR